MATYEAKRDIFKNFGRSVDKVWTVPNQPRRSYSTGLLSGLSASLKIEPPYMALAIRRQAGHMAKAVGKQF